MSAPEVVHTADVVLLASLPNGGRQILLIRRADDSTAYPGMWALPGGRRTLADPTAAHAAVRELAEETGIRLDPEDLTLLGVWDEPGRDPRGVVVTRAFVAWLDGVVEPTAGDDAARACWWPLSGRPLLAFDHDEIVAAATGGAL